MADRRIVPSNQAPYTIGVTSEGEEVLVPRSDQRRGAGVSRGTVQSMINQAQAVPCCPPSIVTGTDSVSAGSGGSFTFLSQAAIDTSTPVLQALPTGTGSRPIVTSVVLTDGGTGNEAFEYTVTYTGTGTLASNTFYVFVASPCGCYALAGSIVVT